MIRNILIRNKLVLRKHFLWTNANLLHEDKELLSLRNNFRVTKKFLITKFDCTSAEIKTKSTDILLKIITILKELRVVQLDGLYCLMRAHWAPVLVKLLHCFVKYQTMAMLNPYCMPFLAVVVFGLVSYFLIKFTLSTLWATAWFLTNGTKRAQRPKKAPTHHTQRSQSGDRYKIDTYCSIKTTCYCR